MNRRAWVKGKSMKKPELEIVIVNKNKLYNAKAAKKQTKDFHSNLDQRAYKDILPIILKEVEVEAKRGEDYMSWGFLDHPGCESVESIDQIPLLVKELRKLGFQISSGTDEEDEFELRISWDDE